MGEPPTAAGRIVVLADALRRGDRWERQAPIAVTDQGAHPVALDADAARALPRLRASVLPPITDAHVHVGLSDLRTGPSATLARVLDLGWTTDAVGALAAAARARRAATEIRFAGAFLTAPGGYPSTRPWAPDGAAVPVAGPADAPAAVAAQHAAGADVVKVALNAVAGPVPDDATLAALVREAHRHALPVVAHVEGAGQAGRAWKAGVDVLAHTPWSESLEGDLIEQMAGRMLWISTLDMHGRGSYGGAFGTAHDNLTRFVAAGGRVAYGTDLGNDLEAADIQPRELDALRATGLDDRALLAAVCGGGLLPTWSGTVSLLPSSVTDDAEAVAALPCARAVHASQIKELLE